MSVPRLAFERLVGGYGSAPVIRELSGTVADGEVLCVLGRNGVGKSTFMKLLFGFLPCWQGQVLLDGNPVHRLSPTARHRLGMSFCPQERPVFEHLSVRDNLTLSRPSRDLAPFTDYFERFPILPRRLAQHAGTLSGGEKKILSFVRGLAEAQRVILLDEPSEGVQWENILHMAAILTARKQTGACFVVVEQNVAFAERIADRYLIIDQGRAVLHGLREEIGRDEVVRHLHV
jgi:branched-chain amino acid transport system ATP-binding protein